MEVDEKPGQPVDCAVIGGGVAGLTVAADLADQGRSVALFERGASLGGSISTVRRDGFLIEEGPNSLLDTHPEVTDLLDRLGIVDQRIFALDAAKKRYIVRDGKPQALPVKPFEFFAGTFFSWKAKLRLMREPFVGRSQDGTDESVADFVKRRLGREFLDYAINPFVAGVYAGDPETLSVANAFPKLHQLEQRYGSLIKGQIQGARERRQRAETAKSHARMYSFRDGLATLPASLGRRLGARAHTDTRVLGLGRTGDHWVVQTQGKDEVRKEVRARAVVYAGRLPELGAMLNGVSDRVSLTPLQEVRYPPVSVLALGFKRSHIGHALDGFGVLVPEVEDRNILGALFSSSIFEARAPEDHELLTVFVGGTRQPELALLEESTLVEKVLRDLRDLLGVQGDPVMIHRRAWPTAIPQYELGYARVKQTIWQIESREDGLFFAGNYRAGISVPDTITNSCWVARNIGEFLG